MCIIVLSDRFKNAISEPRRRSIINICLEWLKSTVTFEVKSGENLKKFLGRNKVLVKRGLSFAFLCIFLTNQLITTQNLKKVEKSFLIFLNHDPRKKSSPGRTGK